MVMMDLNMIVISTMHAYPQGLHVHCDICSDAELPMDVPGYRDTTGSKCTVQAYEMFEQVVQAIEGLQDSQDCAMYWAHKASHG